MIDNKKALKQLSELDRLGDQIRLAADGWDEEWKTLVATIMSARSNDKVTIPVAEGLFRKYNTIEKLASAKIRDVEGMIKKVNFYRNKSRNVVNCCKALVKDFNGKVPHDLGKLIELPGVGRKTANVFLAEYGYAAIGIDTHLGYVSRYLDWSRHINPDKVEQDLLELFPKKFWSRLNWIVVRFGQTYTNRREKDKILDRIKKIR
jgi:endonuclease III